MKLALQWVIAHRVEYNIVAVNITDFLGQGFYPTRYEPEVTQLGNLGVFIASPAGNEGTTTAIGYPSLYPAVYSIGAADQSGALWADSNRGPVLDVIAPGVGITVPYIDPANNNRLGVLDTANGTSFATPHVTGAAVLIKQANPQLTSVQIMDIIKRTGTPVWDNATQAFYPRLNVYAAVQTALSLVGTAGNNGAANSSAFDASGALHMAWYDTLHHDLRYATRSADGIWSNAWEIDATPGAGLQLSLKLHHGSLPGIAYYDSTNADLKYAFFDGANWHTQTVAATDSVGKYPSLAYNADNFAAISYYDATNGNLRLAYEDEDGWHRRTIDSAGDTGLSTSLAAKPNSANWAIAYLKKSTNTFKYAEGPAVGSWTLKTVDTTVKGGAYTSLAFDPSGKPAFSYYDSSITGVKYAHMVGALWKTGVVDAAGTTGLYTNLTFTPAGRAKIVYYSSTLGKARWARGDIGAWTFATLDGGGSYLSVATTSASRQRITWLDSTTGNLTTKSI